MSADATILLVEDNGDDVVLIQRAFRRCNVAARIGVATDGDAAVDYLAAAGQPAGTALPRLVLLDLKLPRRSGLEVLEWIRAQPHTAGLVVVVLTSSREAVDLQRAYALGANSYLVKPVDFDSLSSMIRTLDLYWMRLNEPPPLEDRR